MPLYEYECQQCKRHTEKIQKFSDPEITTCPHCGGVLKRVITAPAIAFKGGGWYKDGYGSVQPSAAKSEGSGGSGGPSGGDSGGSSGDSASSSSSTDGAGAAAPAPAATPAPAPAAAASSSAEKK
jgi:putative FmdB family regulatory protein